MKTLLRDGGGIPNTLLYTLAIIAGISVANLYYNQPLLEMLRQDLHASTMEANHIALYTQIGYALGLLFIIPLADLFSRKRIILANFSVLVVSLLAIATAGSIYTVHVFSLLTGICSVIPQIFIPLTAQYSLPENKNRNVGIVLSGLLTGILASRVVSGAVGEWLGWREMYYIASGLMIVSAGIVLRILPPSRPNFQGTYGALMRSIFTLIRQYPALRIYAVRAAFAFGSFMCFWASLAFKMAEPPFYAGSNIVGMLGLCGVAGTLTASFVGAYIQRVGVRRFNYIGGRTANHSLGTVPARSQFLCHAHCRYHCHRHRNAVHTAQQSGHNVRPESVGIQPHQHHFHDHLLHWRLARHIPFRCGMVVMGMGRSRGCRNTSFLVFTDCYSLHQEIGRSIQDSLIIIIIY